MAIIPDGNRRWAKKNGLQPWDGHEAGAKNVEKVLKANLDLGVKHVTFWGSSVDNLQKRPWREKRALLNVYRKYFMRLLDNEDIHKNQVQVNVIGRWEEQFPPSLKNILHKCMRKTEKYKKHFLNFLLAYSGDDEMVAATNSLLAKCKGKVKRITTKMIKDHLMTRESAPGGSSGANRRRAAQQRWLHDVGRLPTPNCIFPRFFGRISTRKKCAKRF